MTKRSQVTIFLIVGMVMLFIIGGLFYGLSVAKQEKLSTQQQQTTQSTKTTIKYSAYIKSCLDQATKQGLLLVGQQGGLIYNTDYNPIIDGKGITLPNDKVYGTLELPNKITTTPATIKIPFWITRPDFSASIPGYPHPGPPDYPYGNVPLMEEPDMPYFGNFPTSYMTPLCDSFGPNSVLAVSCGTYYGAFDSPVKKEDHHSIQEYLQDFVREATLKCINQGDIIEDLKGYDITDNDMSINITIGESDITTTFSIPKLLKQKTNKNIQELQQITSTLKVRLKQIHELMSQVVINDITNIFFDVNTDFASQHMIKCYDGNGNLVQCARDGMEVRRITGIVGSDEKHHSIIEITDKKNKIDGKSFVFQAAVENRLPALDWINNYNIMYEHGLDSIINEVDVVGFVGEELLIDSKGYDPDEDFHDGDNVMDHNYYYSGWGIDYDETNNYNNPEGALLYCKPEQENDIANAEFILNDGLVNCISTVNPASNPVVDTSKIERQVIKRQLSTQDIGLHNINIKVCDEVGCDWQEVRILVLPS